MLKTMMSQQKTFTRFYPNNTKSLNLNIFIQKLEILIFFSLSVNFNHDLYKVNKYQ